MKGIIKNTLNEALGVPEGILESAERLYLMCFNNQQQKKAIFYLIGLLRLLTLF